MSANGTDRLQVKKIVWTMKNLIPKGDKKLETNSSRIKETNRRMKSREKKIVFDFSIVIIIHFSLIIAIDRFEPPST